MCRAENLLNINWLHMDWKNDALRIYFKKMKNDQDGSRCKEPRSLYANPVKPEVCCILSLGIYLLCFSPTKIDQLVFDGDSQSARYGTLLKIFLTKHASMLRERGFAPSDFGTHSIRKGASTFVTSGTTDAPSQASVNLRGGWTMTSVENTYFRFEKAGDQFVGRTVSGLPINRGCHGCQLNKNQFSKLCGTIILKWTFCGTRIP